MSTDSTHSELIETISTYVVRCSGLDLSDDAGTFQIFQQMDGKTLKFSADQVEEVLEREDSEGNGFLQVNFMSGHKILITEKLIGFKPARTTGLDLKKLPKVVTTPDLLSVVEAIEDSLNSDMPRTEEVEVLRRVFDSVLIGAQAVGFELDAERAWLSCISSVRHKPSA